MSRRDRPRGGPETGRAAARKRPHPTPLRTRRCPTDPADSLDRGGARRGALKGG